MPRTASLCPSYCSACQCSTTSCPSSGRPSSTLEHAGPLIVELIAGSHVGGAAHQSSSLRFGGAINWGSIVQLFMAGGNHPTSEVPCPKGFCDPAQTEIVAAK